MIVRRTIIPTLILAAFIVLSLPSMAAAQGSNQWWQDRDNDRYLGRGNNDFNRFRRERLRASARRISNLSRQFERDLDRSLDRSRIDGTIREDRINERAREFRFAAEELRDRLGYGRNLYSSTSAARNLLQLGSQIDRMMSRFRLDSRTESDWVQIRQELRVISDAYGFRNGDFGYGRGNW